MMTNQRRFSSGCVEIHEIFPLVTLSGTVALKGDGGGGGKGGGGGGQLVCL